MRRLWNFSRRGGERGKHIDIYWVPPTYQTHSSFVPCNPRYYPHVRDKARTREVKWLAQCPTASKQRIQTWDWPRNPVLLIFSLFSHWWQRLWSKACSPRGIWEWVSCIFPASGELRNLLSKPDDCMRLKIPVVVFIRKTKCLENTNKETRPVNVFPCFQEDSLGTLWVHMSELSTYISTQTILSYRCYTVNTTCQKRGMHIGDSLKVILRSQWHPKKGFVLPMTGAPIELNRLYQNSSKPS